MVECRYFGKKLAEIDRYHLRERVKLIPFSWRGENGVRGKRKPPRGRLTAESKRQLQKAISECNQKKYDENDIISHITFGFWVNLFDYDAKRNQHVIYWQKVLKPIFNRRFSNFKELYNTLKQIMRFRNRLYHQEIVWNKRIAKKPEHALANLEKTYRQFESALQKIAPERFIFRQLSQALIWQRNIFFDQQLFEAEITVLPQHI